MSEILRKIRIPLESGETRELAFPEMPDVPGLLDYMGQLTFKQLTLDDFDHLSSYDPATIYFVHYDSFLYKITIGSRLIWLCEIPGFYGELAENPPTPSTNYTSLSINKRPQSFWNGENGLKFYRTLDDLSGFELYWIYTSNGPESSYIKKATLAGGALNSVKFREAAKLEYVNLRALNTERLVSCYQMFCGCSSLREIIMPALGFHNIATSYQMFTECSSLKEIDLSMFTTSGLNDMNAMFYRCTSLREIDLSMFDTSKVTTMSCLFYECKNLEKINIDNFSCNILSSVDSMFCGCEKLTEIKFPLKFNCYKVSKPYNMFKDCKSLKSLDLSNFLIAIRTDPGFSTGMFDGCESIECLDISNFDFNYTSVESQMFKDCKSLSHLKFGKNLRRTFNFSACPLDYESVTSILSHLETAVKGAQLIFNQSTYDLMTEADIALATEHGFSIVIS